MTTLEERVDRLERRLAGLTYKTLDRLDVLGPSNLHGQTILGTYPDNYAQFSNTGHLTLTGTATVWNDANVGSLVLQTGGTLPGIVEWLDNTGAGTGIYGRGWAIGESGSGVIEIPHDYKEGTDLTFHVHWGTNDAPTGKDYAKWQVVYFISRSSVTTPVIATLTVEVECIQYEHKMSNLAPVITGTNLKIGDQVNFSISRIAADGDAYGGEILAETLGFHYECDTLGSNTIATK